MSEFQKHSYKKKIMYSPITLVLLAIVVIVAIYGVIDIIPKYLEASRARDVLLKKQEVLREREAHIQSELIKLQTPAGIEENIREKLNVVRDGEQVVVIVDQPEQPPASNSTSSGTGGFWNWVMNLFK